MVLPMNKRTKRKKNRFSKFLVTMVILLNILFTVAVLYVFLQTGSEPVTLIGCWFAFTTGELWMLSSIKKSKVKKEGDDINENN
jgi:ABC-type phosphate transport system permease subunit